MLEDAKEVHIDEALAQGKKKAKNVQRRGERSLAMYLGDQPAPRQRDRVSPEDVHDLPDTQDFEPPERQ